MGWAMQDRNRPLNRRRAWTIAPALNNPLLPDSFHSSALRTSARPSHRLLNYASGCAVRASHSG